MTAAAARRRKRPFNPALAEYQAKQQAAREAEKRDRKSRDLLRNARVAAAEVDDPISGDRVVVLRSVRDDPIADMLARGHVDQCEFETARHWQRAYEGAEIGGACGIDPSKEFVDGGCPREVLSDRQIKATKELKAAREELGAAGNWLVVSVLGTKKTLEMVAWEWRQAKPGDASYRYVTRRFRECLKTLSELFGYASPTPRHGRA